MENDIFKIWTGIWKDHRLFMEMSTVSSQVEGSSKRSFRLFCNIEWKKLNQNFGQPNTATNENYVIKKRKD